MHLNMPTPPQTYADIAAYWGAFAISMADINALFFSVTGENAHKRFTHGDTPLQLEQQQHIARITERLQTGEPVAYILGYTEFWGVRLHVNPHTLIPRPDTELLVEHALQQLASKHLASEQSPHAQPLIVDLGTGSGAIALALASEYPSATIHAVDQSAQALHMATYNAEQLKLHHVHFHLGHWFDALPTALRGTIDLIVSNPPYINAQDQHLKLLQHEPLSALVAEEDGLADLKWIIQGAAAWLKPHGILMIEHGFDQGTACRELFYNANFHEITTLQDYGGQERVTLGIKH